MSVFIGIDPGKNGGIACWDLKTNTVELEPFTGPKSRGGHFHIASVIDKLAAFPRPEAIVLEEVGPRPGEGAVSVATFARCHGLLLGMVHMLRAVDWMGAEILRPKPQAWKAAVLAGYARSDAGEAEAFGYLTSCSAIFGERNEHTQDALFLAAYGAINRGHPLPT